MMRLLTLGYCGHDNIKSERRMYKIRCSQETKMAGKQEEIEQSIAFLEKNLAKVFTDDAVKQKMWPELKTKKRELETIIQHQSKGAILRSKSRWYNECKKKCKILS